nr:immunoglobulin heavy chain junction region [Macaca mulatta]
CARSPPEY